MSHSEWTLMLLVSCYAALGVGKLSNLMTGKVDANGGFSRKGGEGGEQY